jgi:hypothetical protein
MGDPRPTQKDGAENEKENKNADSKKQPSKARDSFPPGMRSPEIIFHPRGRIFQHLISLVNLFHPFVLGFFPPLSIGMESPHQSDPMLSNLFF